MLNFRKGGSNVLQKGMNWISSLWPFSKGKSSDKKDNRKEEEDVEDYKDDKDEDFDE